MHLPAVLPYLFLAVLPSTIAWGSLGHRTVAYYASLSLDRDAAVFVNHLLNGQDVSEAALFPDKIAHVR